MEVMATLESDYYDTQSSYSHHSFELDDLSEGDPDPLMESKEAKSPSGRPPLPQRQNGVAKKPPAHSGIDMGRTVKNPLKLAQHLSKAIDGAVQIPSALRSDQSSTKKKPPRFKKAVNAVQNLQSVSSNFKSSNEVREVAYKDWLAKKEVKAVQMKRTSLLEKKKEEEAKKKKEVNDFFFLV